MQLYKLKPLFDKNSGAPDGHQLIPTGKYICDFTGELLDPEEGLNPEAIIEFEYNDDAEQAWYYDDLDELLKLLPEDSEDLDFDIRRELAEPGFTFMCDESGVEIGFLQLVAEWKHQESFSEGPFASVTSLGELCRTARMQTVLKLLKEGKYKPEELIPCLTNG